MSDDIDVLEAEVNGALALAGSPEIDIQVATARRFPRSITRFIQKAQEMATLTPEIAASCIYALPRKENGRQKNIEGPSARFAEIMASAYQNLRAEGKVLGNDDRYVTSRGTAWDVENNVAIAFEVRRRVTNREGETFNDDMIAVTGNAAASIALRNAILKAIPTSFWKPIYLQCRKVVAGDVRTFGVRRDNMLHEFAVMGVTEERLLAALGIKGKADITLEHMATLAGFYTALKEGETTIEEAFPESGGLGTPQPAQRKSQQNGGSPAPAPVPVTTSAGTAQPAPASTSEPEQKPAPAYVGTITDIQEKPTGFLIVLSTGFRCATNNKDFVGAAKLHQQAGTVVELTCRAPKNPANLPILEEIARYETEV